MTILNGRRRAWMAATVAVLVTAVSGCTTEAGEDGTQRRESSDNEQRNADAVQDKIDALYRGESYAAPPAEGPPAQRGTKVFMVNAGVQAPTGSAVAQAAKDVAKIMDWDLSIYDGKFQPSGYQEGIRQAIAVGADIIWDFGIDCPVARAALEEAKEAGIPVIGQEAADCSDVDKAAPSLFAENLHYAEGDFLDWARALGASQADWIIARTGGQAKVVEIAVPDIITAAAVHEGFLAEMKTCDTCEVLQTVQSSAAVLGPELQAKIEQTLLRNADANAMAVSYDDLMTGGGASAVRASGRSGSLEVVSGTGFKANVKLIRDDAGQDAAYGVDYDYETWSAADTINRFLAGAEQMPGVVGVQLFDRDHGLPEHTYTAPITDFKERYIAVWTAGS